VKDDPLLVCLKLSKSGYGSLVEVEEWDARRVLQALSYEAFIEDYENAYMELQRDSWRA
jgi:hypothetical protein